MPRRRLSTSMLFYRHILGNIVFYVGILQMKSLCQSRIGSSSVYYSRSSDDTILLEVVMVVSLSVFMLNERPSTLVLSAIVSIDLIRWACQNKQYQAEARGRLLQIIHRGFLACYIL